MVESEGGGRRRHHDDRDEELRQELPAEDPLHAAEREHERDGREPHEQRRDVDRAPLRHREPEPVEEMIVRVADRLEAEQVLHLVEDEEHARARREADDDRMRDVAREVAEPQADRELNRAHGERHQHRRLHLLVGAGDAADRAQERDRDRVRRAVDELARRVQHRADRGHDDRRVEPVLRWQARDHRVGHRLRHRDGGDRAAGEEVGARGREVVAPQRIERRDAPQEEGERGDGVAVAYS